MYIFYLLKFKKSEIISKPVGSIQKNLYISALETLDLCHDDIKDQQKISSILSCIDNKIENMVKTDKTKEVRCPTLRTTDSLIMPVEFFSISYNESRFVPLRTKELD